ncbi:hypothetical protein FOPG_16830 [Fusarium oxysporum f. sp. conglutinans race 2 54008]|uniref:Major facilitator superfamily (MFS) profile domain-containing protein n=1 Tax=Fusarium oxysporum f. sp. conglutinans race 2 54008 TaxID=1089457 RepID=X0H4Z5_FUSOX|nr:hypothetical protein FOPG_16830 [Fusarium oxysporum f. sp. conglutinans race 2 54008]
MSTTSTVLIVEQSTPARSERFEVDRHRTSVRDTESNRAQVPVYSRFSNVEKRGITALLAFCGVLATMSMTSIFAAIPEIVQEYETTATILNMSGAIYLVFMGLSSCIWGSAADIFGRRKTERATSLGWFLAGTMFGPAFGPAIGRIIVTYKSWRIFFWIDLKEQGFTNGAKRIWRWANPATVFKLYACRNLLFVTLASSALSGMLYISPGVGYVIGVQIGGRWSDYTVKQWIKKRGYRLPEDRLRSCLLFLDILLPASIIIYGRMIEKRLGGVPVPVICMFFQGIAQLAAFPSLNAYILDVMHHRSGEASGMSFSL